MIFFQKSKQYLLKVVQPQERPREEASETKKRISPTEHKSIACLESNKQHAFMCSGTRPLTATV